ncbi:hypothetical protein TeGR_g13518, partial [Tetraparma gracilis]
MTSHAADLLVYATGKNDASLSTYPRERIDSIILSCSQNSDYYRQQLAKDERTNASIERRRQSEPMTAPLPPGRASAIAALVAGYEASRRCSATCVVVDMDMFYFACELARPEWGGTPRTVTHRGRTVRLDGIPAVVGKGMVLTSNYVARKFGVRSAMAGFIARRLVAELSGGREALHEVGSDMGWYVQCSRNVREVLGEYDPGMRCYSLDEVYMDLGRYVKLRNGGYSHEAIQRQWGAGEGGEAEVDRAAVTGLPKPKRAAPPPSAASGSESEPSLPASGSPPPAFTVAAAVSEMRAAVKLRTRLTCSAGIAPSHALAKIASDCNKPDGQCEVQ